MALDELQAAIRRVIDLDLPMHNPVWLSRPTDSSRLVERYRDGRAFLAGDAAHVHWAYGGKGLQTGIKDAGNLGWKLAALAQRRDVLARARQRLLGPGDHHQPLPHGVPLGVIGVEQIGRCPAMNLLVGQFLTHEQTYRSIVEAISDVDILYDMGADRGDRHPLLGRWAPNLALHTERGTTHVAELMYAGKGVLLDLAGRSA